MKAEAFIAEYGKWLEQGVGALFVGAGLSQAAGYPSWRELLRGIADELHIDLAQEQDLAGVAQWYINRSGRIRTRIERICNRE